ncbi:uncharacterized protein LOC114527174 [Dendronephthya gigantea]|uniref:uncharacterized protein LOC114527174 n=1 Tax=Dendronephthya gigantea TaxID=151771 RepID=UPI00106C23EE|nr:uncharacterized protein LOC114527174 [Dendronephthya gigantea]
MASSLISLLKQELLSSKQKKAIKPLATALVLWGIEQLLETTKYYDCPKEGHALYGGMFLFGPAFCLFMLTLMSTNSFWDSITSCFRKNEINRIVACRNACYGLTKSALVALIWLLLSLGTTDHFVCFRLGANRKDANEVMKMKRLSSVLAWFMLVLSVLLAIVYRAVEKCCFLASRESIGTLLRDYKRIEEEAAISTFKKEAKALAKREGENQVKAILSEVDDGKTAMEVVKKAKQWLIEKYSRKKKVEKKNYQENVELVDITTEHCEDRKRCLLDSPNV